MAKLRHATRAYACIGDDLSELIARLDAFLIQFRDDIQIATLLLGRLDPDRAALELVSAGHPPPLLARGHDSEYLAVPPGPPLGSWHGQEAFRLWRTRLAPDDALLMYTDGLLERRSELLDQGFERLRTIVRDTKVQDAERLCEVAVAGCLAGLRRTDDVCLLALHRHADATDRI